MFLPVIDLDRLIHSQLSSSTSSHMSQNLCVDNAQMGLAQADGDEGLAACNTLNIEVIPTIQFWKNKQLLWEHRGVTALDQDLSEGAATCIMQALCCQHFNACSHADCIGQQQRLGVPVKEVRRGVLCVLLQVSCTMRTLQQME